MTIKRLTQKYQLSDSDIDNILKSLSSGETLLEAKKRLASDLSSEAIYSIAKELCRIEMGLPISEINPEFVEGRAKLNKARIAERQKSEGDKKQVNYIRHIRDDINLCLLELSIV
ncbi:MULTISPECIES: hypothetical protein [Vibrio]|nr:MULTISPECIES: hypothetical protein [Vibrio]EJG0764681.1 hypothetical protein [Vibrio parahaemolyticus O5:K30]ARN69574.1 hypothetical protein FORC36_5057 [Vibrio vulnificus]EGR2854752.1 hypothetical protein [Vibrio parahaemolyticus]EGR3310005.1 hypothetical protein [Vibrio parahaemolyticus]ELA8197471.1 hypothetical protein [Vibrio parahaemolyticus]